MARQTPIYKPEVLDELPADVGARRRGPSSYYATLLEAAVDNPGKWVRIAIFRNRGGARLAAKSLREGKRALPDVDGGFEFDYRRVTVDENGQPLPEGTVWSWLVARYHPDA